MLVRVVLLSAFTLATAPALAAQTASLEWLSGCWEHRKGNMVITEQWSLPRAGMMLGSGHTTKGAATLEYEQTRIFDRGGKLVYEARPSGQARAEFVANGATATGVEFANPAHDFPQRVSYRPVGTDSLIARVAGKSKGREQAVDFRYVRVQCSAARNQH